MLPISSLWLSTRRSFVPLMIVDNLWTIELWMFPVKKKFWDCFPGSGHIFFSEICINVRQCVACHCTYFVSLDILQSYGAHISV